MLLFTESGGTSVLNALADIGLRNERAISEVKPRSRRTCNKRVLSLFRAHLRRAE